MQCVVSSGQQSAIGYRLFVFREIGVPNPSHKDIYTISKCLSYTGFHGMSGDAEQTGSLCYKDAQTTYVLSNSTNISYCWKSALQAVETCVIIGYKGLIRMLTTFSPSKQTFPGSAKMSLLKRFSPRL